jgi:hypothetical protein
MTAIDARAGYGNDGPVDITERCPPALGKLAQNARFPHFHSRSLREEEQEQRPKTEQGLSIIAGHQADD